MSRLSFLSAPRRTRGDYGLTLPAVRVIELAPILIVLGMTALLQIPRTRPRAKWLLLENHPVELATFGFLLVGGLVGLALVVATKRRSEGFVVYGFYTVFSLGLLVTAMEEVAWGQLLFGFEPPEFMQRLNAKGETTIHNIRGLDGRTEILRVTFGLGGLVGLWLARRPLFEKIAPPPALWTWFSVILGLALFDLWDDLTMPPDVIFDLIFRLNELNEMLVGLAGLLFVSLNFRRFRRNRA